MYDQVKALKEGKSVDKPIYNHVTGVFDPAEKIESPDILILEGLHPFADERVREMFDFKIYLDISDDVKFAWKIQRDMAERGHSLESIKASIEARKPDFDEFVDPQKQYADVVIQVLPTQLIPDDNEGKILRVRMIMKEGVENFDAPYLFDEGSTISWIPCGRKLTCSYPGIKFFYGPDTFFGEEVSVLEMDGQFDKLEELIYVESTSPTPPPSSMARSPSRCSSTRTARAPTTAPASSRPSAASRCASSTSALLRLRSSSRRKFTALATVLRVGVARGRYAGRIEGSKS